MNFYIILIGLLFLLAVVFGILSAKTWRWPDVLAGFLVVLAAVGFLILLSASMSKRRQQLRELASQEKRYESNKQKNVQLLYGDRTEEGSAESYTALSTRLSRFLLDRGRVWRECVPTANNDETFNVTIPGADAANPHQIAKRFILYVFREQDVEGRKQPAAYVGEFEVINTTDTGVQLRPILYGPRLNQTRDQTGAQFLANLTTYYVNGRTWSLYETLPVDDHELYNDSEGQPNLAEEGQPAFGPVNEAEIAQVVQFAAQEASDTGPIAPEIQQAIIQRYVRDGRRTDPTVDRPDDIYTKVRFLKSYKEKVDTDAVSGGAETIDFFDAQGQAQVEFLGVDDEKGEVELGEDDVALLPRQQAEALIQAGVCERVEDVFVRDLTDYSSAFHTTNSHILEVVNKNLFLNKNIALIQQLNDSLSKMLQVRQTERLKLEGDLQKVSHENKQLQSLSDQVDTQLTTLKSNIRDLLGKCLEYEQRIELAQRYIAENVERNVEEATTAP